MLLGLLVGLFPIGLQLFQPSFTPTEAVEDYEEAIIGGATQEELDGLRYTVSGSVIFKGTMEDFQALGGWTSSFDQDGELFVVVIADNPERGLRDCSEHCFYGYSVENPRWVYWTMVVVLEQREVDCTGDYGFGRVNCIESGDHVFWVEKPAIIPLTHYISAGTMIVIGTILAIIDIRAAADKSEHLQDEIIPNPFR